MELEEFVEKIKLMLTYCAKLPPLNCGAQNKKSLNLNIFNIPLITYLLLHKTMKHTQNV